MRSNYPDGKRFMYKHVTHLNTINVEKGTGMIIDESINVPRRSMKDLLFLFYEAYVTGARQ